MVLVSTMWVLGCALSAETSAGPDEETDSLLPPPDEPGADAVPLGDPCQSSSDCAQSAICAAPWDGSASPLVCSNGCIASGDQTQWCADDEACCDPDAICGSRGLCQSPAGADDTGSGPDTPAGSGTKGASTTGGMGTAGTQGSSSGGRSASSSGGASSSSSG